MLFSCETGGTRDQIKVKVDAGERGKWGFDGVAAAANRSRYNRRKNCNSDGSSEGKSHENEE
jgi:hypothetical protein